jgi:hypothetical protein
MIRKFYDFGGFDVGGELNNEFLWGIINTQKQEIEKLKEQLQPKDVCFCGVPHSLHNTCCGWINANCIVFPHEKTIGGMSAEEKELRYLISLSPNADEIAKQMFKTFVIVEQ